MQLRATEVFPYFRTKVLSYFRTFESTFVQYSTKVVKVLLPYHIIVCTVCKQYV